MEQISSFNEESLVVCYQNTVPKNFGTVLILLSSYLPSQILQLGIMKNDNNNNSNNHENII